MHEPFLSALAGYVVLLTVICGTALVLTYLFPPKG